MRDFEVQQDFLKLKESDIDNINHSMSFALIAFSSLLINTNSPKDCEDGYFTGYLISLSSFSVCSFLSLICEATVQAFQLKGFKYIEFFSKL